MKLFFVFLSVFFLLNDFFVIFAANLVNPLSLLRVSREWTDKTTVLVQGWHGSKG
jgi:hypothetical protein